MGEIFHVCRSAGREFTQEEWFEYCNQRRNNPEKAIRTTIGKYTFNDNDVCLNPEVITLKVDDKRTYGYEVSLKWCYCGNGLWQYGIDYNTGDGGGGFSPSFASPDEKREWLRGYPSERECKLAACEAAKNRLYNSYHKGDPKVKRLWEMVDEYQKTISRPKIVQLELF